MYIPDKNFLSQRNVLTNISLKFFRRSYGLATTPNGIMRKIYARQILYAYDVERRGVSSPSRDVEDKSVLAASVPYFKKIPWMTRYAYAVA